MIKVLDHDIHSCVQEYGPVYGISLFAMSRGEGHHLNNQLLKGYVGHHVVIFDPTTRILRSGSIHDISYDGVHLMISCHWVAQQTTKQRLWRMVDRCHLIETELQHSFWYRGKNLNDIKLRGLRGIVVNLISKENLWDYGKALPHSKNEVKPQGWKCKK